MFTVSIASDHAGFRLKEKLRSYLENLGYAITDNGCTAQQKCADYSDYAVKVIRDIESKKADYGILICGTGSGMSIVANRFEGIRAVLCNNVEIVKLAREHNDANVLCLGARFTTDELAKDIVKKFLETKFSNEQRHKKRLAKLNNLNEKAETKTYNEEEISKFARIANDWWNENGKFKPLHAINPIRVQYIIDKIKELKQRSLKDVSLLDIGCGGGILSESMARVCANVTGIDACKENIKVAQLHAEKVGLNNIEYLHTSVEELSNNKQYDVILLMETVEHVDNLEFFIKKTIELLKPGGLIFVSTINRTIKSFLLAIVGAEYILNWLPKGTHSWKKFLKPSEIAHLFGKNNVALYNMTGIEYSIRKSEWCLTENFDINYVLCGKLND
ncbi:MAG: bifunctional 2-polyprenyl-6-hydroxyphenol methylase/3-demethylubiquinol 3-O-methyltransferase UbiG [Wolbachia endosymbiont of Tyrophagus putrescentiae]|nr:bifunctional 2-polyprenyl-6-hydroxyphenol methylase/3-demethylubiquinol 3-O-methyltransferase UbiG [Wolbachia endosymbiont of Tyrophagus putrescentiae]